MKKNTLLLRLSRLFVVLFLGFSIQSYQLNAKNRIAITKDVSEHSILIKQSRKADKNLIKGLWGRTEGVGEINISEVRDNGLLKATFCNPKSINIEKAVWTNSSDVLRIYILLREDNYPGSSFSLNYIAEKDLLLGVYFDALTNISYTVSFKRVK
ncbi:hypothetical protein [Flavobacterium aestivum]|uniref:hypothetical protein n=1 Tax=Flavobacterium aestivum TaxID=3003257 RepID=UPI002482AECB|nr:hypothetical protein [Flavobacterium aestivum]